MKKGFYEDESVPKDCRDYLKELEDSGRMKDLPIEGFTIHMNPPESWRPKAKEPEKKKGYCQLNCVNFL